MSASLIKLIYNFRARQGGLGLSLIEKPALGAKGDPLLEGKRVVGRAEADKENTRVHA